MDETQTQKAADKATAPATPAGEGGDNKGAAEPDLSQEVPVKVDGKETTVTLKEAIDGYMRQSDYTKKRQAESEEVKAAKELADKLTKEKAELEAKVAKTGGAEEMIQVLAERLNPPAVDPFASREAVSAKWQSDPEGLLKEMALKMAEKPRADPTIKAEVEALKEQLEKSNQDASKWREDAMAAQKARDQEALEAQIKAQVPEYGNNKYVNMMTKYLSNHDQPADELGGKIGKDMHPMEVAKAMAAYNQKRIETELAAAKKASEEKTRLLPSGNAVSSAPLPDLPDEIANITNPAERLVAKSKWIQEQIKARGG